MIERYRFMGDIILQKVFLMVLLVGFLGCAGSKPYTSGPIKTFDPDTADIPEPEGKVQYQYWDRIHNTFFYQLEKPLNLNRTFRSFGQLLGIADPEPAHNVNQLGEVPESSWYTKRHYYHHMSPEELARGPNTVKPDTGGIWTIFRGKLKGANSGFFIEDENGHRFLIKFDGYKYPELTTAADVISSKFFYAAGYYVPEAAITHFRPEQVKIGKNVTVEVKGKKVPMNRDHLQQIIENRATNEEGKIRAYASKFVDGKPVGPWGFEGTRSDDPNDLVHHEDRRELRGMRIISAWLNDTDRRDANTMAVYTEEGYIKHYVQDFGNTLGANGMLIHEPIYGQAYLVDPRYIGLSMITFGANVRPWETVEPEVSYPSVGYFPAEPLKPAKWVPVHPIPAFENMTPADAFWGAKKVMSFRDEDIRAVVEAGRITNPEAETYLVEMLIKRRDKIGRYWFSRMNPVDRFKAEHQNGQLTLRFDDLGVDGELFTERESSYHYNIEAVNQDYRSTGTAEKPEITADLSALSRRTGDAEPTVLKIHLVTRRSDHETAEKFVEVYVAMERRGLRIVGIEREQ